MQQYGLQVNYDYTVASRLQDSAWARGKLLQACLTSAALTCALPMSRTSICQGMMLVDVPSMKPFIAMQVLRCLEARLEDHKSLTSIK